MVRKRKPGHKRAHKFSSKGFKTKRQSRAWGTKKDKVGLDRKAQRKAEHLAQYRGKLT